MAVFLGLPSSWDHLLLIAILVLIPVVFFSPSFVRFVYRLSGHAPPAERPRLSLWKRGLCILLAYTFLIGPDCLNSLSYAAVQYNQISTLSWGQDDTIITYGYDSNGSLTSKTTTHNSETTEVITYEYNLQKRLAKITTTPYSVGSPGDPEEVEYRYNPGGVRVQKTEGDLQTDYLINPANHTGYAQVLEENTYDISNPSTPVLQSAIYYTIGDDVISQTKAEDVSGTWTVSDSQYLLYDGHGSTRQLLSHNQTIADTYNYDAYGVLLQNSSADPGITPQQDTSLLYAGEMFDFTSQHYYNRARWYNSLNGRFGRVDPYSGNMQDPQSLHKYLYVHANPINEIDPSGNMTLLDLLGTLTNIARMFIKYYPILKYGLIVVDILNAAYIVMKAMTQGLSSVTAAEWAELTLIAATAIFGGKVARRLAKSLIRRALKVPVNALKSFKGLENFIRSKGILLEIDDIVTYTKNGGQVLGEFTLIGKNADEPVIYLYKGGDTISTLIHEFVHYCQWKHFVGGTVQDWINFSNIGKYREYLENIAYFVSDVFLK